MIDELIARLKLVHDETIHNADITNVTQVLFLFAISTEYENKTSFWLKFKAFLAGLFIQGQSQSLAAYSSSPYLDNNFKKSLVQQVQRKFFPIRLTLAEENMINGLHFTPDIQKIRQLVELTQQLDLTMSGPQLIHVTRIERA